MLRKLLSGMGLASVLVASANAQIVFHYNGGGAVHDYNSKFGQFQTGAPAGYTNGVAFQVWCVDQQVPITPGDTYLVNVSNLNGSLANTLRNDVVKYTKAAYLANGMGSDVVDGQYAIWAVIHNKTFLCADTWNGGADNDPACNPGLVQGRLNQAGANYGSINKSQWNVITGRAPAGVTDGIYNSAAYDGSNKQEFISHNDSFIPPNVETTPEPATMSLLALGLAGMAGAGLRRRKK